MPDTGAYATGAYLACFDETLGVVRVTTAIAAPPDRVFEALTNPVRITTWWGAEGARLHCRVTLRRGGEWRVASRDEVEPPVVYGHYLIVEPPRVLAFTCLAGRHGFLQTVVRCELSSADIVGAPGTRLALAQTGFAGRLAAGRAQVGVWGERLVRLAAHLGGARAD